MEIDQDTAPHVQAFRFRIPYSKHRAGTSQLFRHRDAPIGDAAGQVLQ
jgi:hypothetical protein